MMKYTEYIDELPPVFSCWLEFHAAIKEHLKEDTRVVKYDLPKSPNHEEITSYTCQIQFIKAMCFDEMMEAWENHREKGTEYEIYSGGVAYYNEEFSRKIFYNH